MEPLNKAYHIKTEDVAGIVYFNLFMGSSGKYKLPSNSP